MAALQLLSMSLTSLFWLLRRKLRRKFIGTSDSSCICPTSLTRFIAPFILSSQGIPVSRIQFNDNRLKIGSAKFLAGRTFRNSENYAADYFILEGRGRQEAVTVTDKVAMSM